MQIPSSLSLRNIVLNTNWRSSEHLCCSQTQPVMEAALGPDQGHNQLVESFFFNLITSPKLLCLNIFWNVLQYRNLCIFSKI